MNASSPSSRVQRLFAESGLASSHEPIDQAVVSTLLEKEYHLAGRLQRLPTEKDDTFRLRTGSTDYLVKVSPPDEADVVVGLQTAAMRFLEREAPELPVQRVQLSVGGSDNVVIEARVTAGLECCGCSASSEARSGPRPSPDAEQLAKVGEMLGRVDVALEEFAHPADRRALVWDIRHFHDLTGLVEHTPMHSTVSWLKGVRSFRRSRRPETG